MRFRAQYGIWRTLAMSVLLVALAGCTAQQPPLRAPYFSATSISLDSPTDGWAVGNWIVTHSDPIPTSVAFGDSIGSPIVTITPAMAHLQHGQWRLAPASVTGSIKSDSYQAVRMLSPTDGWAASVTAIYHYDGIRWSKTASDSIWITDLRLLSPTEGWAVGRFGILRFSHGVWQDVTATLPKPPADWRAGWNYPGLHSVAIVSSTDAWATGDGGVIWHFDGAQWRIASSPYFPNRYYTSPEVNGGIPNDTILAHFAQEGHAEEAIYATQMLSATQGWSVGGAVFAPSFGWGPAVIEAYQAGTWQVSHIVMDKATPPRWPVFYCLAMTSAQDGWIGGAWMHYGPPSQSTGDAGTIEYPTVPATLLLHYHAGQWTYAQAPDVGALHSLAMVNQDEGWAAADGGLLHYSGGQWRAVAVGA